MKMKIQLIKICGCSESNVQREMYYMNAYVRKEKIYNQQSKFPSQETTKREAN